MAEGGAPKLNRRNFLKAAAVVAGGLAVSGGAVGVATEIGKNSMTPENFLKHIENSGNEFYKKVEDQNSLYDQVVKVVGGLQEGYEVPKGYSVIVDATFTDGKGNSYNPSITITDSGIDTGYVDAVTGTKTGLKFPRDVFGDALARKEFISNARILIKGPKKDVPSDIDENLLAPAGQVREMKNYIRVKSYQAGFLHPNSTLNTLDKSKIESYDFYKEQAGGGGIVLTPDVSLGIFYTPSDEGDVLNYFLKNPVEDAFKVSELTMEVDPSKYESAKRILGD